MSQLSLGFQAFYMCSTVRGTARRPHFSLDIVSVTVQHRIQVFLVRSVYFNLRNILLKSGAFLLGHSVYIYIYIYMCVRARAGGSVVVKALRYQSDGPGIDSRWFHWGPTTLVVPNVKKIRDSNLPRTPWATSDCCGMNFTLYIYIYIYIYVYMEYACHQVASYLQRNGIIKL